MMLDSVILYVIMAAGCFGGMNGFSEHLPREPLIYGDLKAGIRENAIQESVQVVSSGGADIAGRPMEFGTYSKAALRASKNWYSGILEAGYGSGTGDFGQNNLRVNIINGFRVGRFSSFGLGIGYRHLFARNSDPPFMVSGENQFAVFMDFRTSFSTVNFTPFLSAGLGSISSYNPDDSGKTSFLFYGSGGLRYNFPGGLALLTGITIEMTRLDYSDTSPFTGIFTRNIVSPSINLGVAF